jgi:hypothetical protein
VKATICAAILGLTIATATAAERDAASANYLLPYCKITREQAAASARDALNLAGVWES